MVRQNFRGDVLGQAGLYMPKWTAQERAPIDWDELLQNAEVRSKYIAEHGPVIF